MTMETCPAQKYWCWKAVLAVLGLSAAACSTIDGKVTLTDSDGDGVPDTRDCAPDDPDIRPGMDEICDGEDQDCDGEIDENAIDAEEEICDGLDNDCDGEIDEDLAITLYPDEDGDGYGDARRPVSDCDPDAGLVENNDDCDDSDETINPEGIEICDELDNDCDDLIDEDLTTTYYADTDGDGFGDPENSGEFCAPEDGWLTDSDDCDDSDETIYPLAPESCNDGIDQDCDGQDTFCLIYGDLLLDPDADITLSGVVGEAHTGSQIGFLNDLDGDGMEEIWLTSPALDTGTAGGVNTGGAHVAFIDTTFRAGVIDLSAGSGSGWDTVLVEGTGRDYFNASWMEDVGDVDGDGLGDVVMGSTLSRVHELEGGTAALVLGSTLLGGDMLLSDADITWMPDGRYWEVGSAATGAGDLNGDGFDDIIIGAEGRAIGSTARPGGIFVWLGCDTGIGACADTDGDSVVDVLAEYGSSTYLSSADESVYGASGTVDRVGSSVVSNFDFNGDGMTDILVGARGAASGAGEVYLLLDFPFSTVQAWSQASIVIEGTSALAPIGDVLESPGDQDGDGYDDLWMGMPLADGEAGRVYFFHGRGDIELSGMPRTMSIVDTDITLYGELAGEQFGSSVSAGGDIDGDGVPELLVGAPLAEPGSVRESGEVRILRGPPAADMADDPLARISGTSEEGRVGSDVSSGVDMDGDGWAEVLVGASGFAGNGAGFLLFGGYHP
jgi:hypothetical protein